MDNRSTLKNYFKTHKVPTESQFSSLIDTMISKNDDGLTKEIDQPLKIQAAGTSEELIKFYQNFEDANAAWLISQKEGDHIGFNIKSGGISRFFIRQDNGNIGIGTSEPEGSLHIASAGDATLILEADKDNVGEDDNPMIKIRQDGGTVGINIGFDNTNFGGNIFGIGTKFLEDETWDTFTINPANNNIGIGTKNSTAPLQIKATSNTSPDANGLYIYNETNAASQHAIIAARVAGTQAGNPFVSFDVRAEYGWSVGLDNSDSNKFKIAGSWSALSSNTRLTIDTSGNLGVGTTSPGFKLEVNGSLRANKYVIQNNINGGSTRGIMMWNASDTNWGIYMGQPGTGKSLSGGTAVAGEGFASYAIRFRVNNTSKDGFIFENKAEKMLMSIRGSDGFTSINGPLKVTRAGKTYPHIHLHNPDTAADSIMGLKFTSEDGWSVQLRSRKEKAWIEITDNGGNSKHYWNSNLYYPGSTATSIRGTGAALRIDSGKGYIDVGCQNTEWAHFYTDRGKYYFSKEIQVDSGKIGSYDDDLSLCTGGTKRVHIKKSNGRVGIGISSPKAPLHVYGSGDGLATHYAWLCRKDSHASVGQIGKAAGTIKYSIISSGRILCPEINCTSDSRIKDVIGINNPEDTLKIIDRIRVMDYKYIDEVANGTGKKKGFIAQQVEKVLPEAVKHSSEFVPDIYNLSSGLVFNKSNKTLKIKIEQAHKLQTGDLVKIYSKDEMLEKEVTKVISNTEFEIKDWDIDVDQVFVYGKKVDDFRSLDYDHIFSVGIGAIQALIRQNENQQSQIESLQKSVNELYDLKKLEVKK